MATKGKWTDAEIKVLVKHYQAHGARYCVKALGRTPASVYQKALVLGIVKEPRYSEAELKYIKTHYAKKGPMALSREMDRSQKAIRSMAVRLGVAVEGEVYARIMRDNRSKWTDESLARQSESMKQYRGKRSPSWKGGVCNVSEMIRGRLYSAWTKYVFQRDDFTCRLCGETGGRLVAHHVRTFAQIRDAVIAQHPDLNLDRYEDREKVADLVIEAHELRDGITLCRDCHQRHHLENGVNCGNILAGHAEDNPQPSRSNVLKIVDRKVQRLTGEDAQSDKPDTSAPMLNSLGQMR